MSKPKHTPGPWIAFCSSYTVAAQGRSELIEIAHVKSPKSVAGPKLKTECKANARLIAAAPQMYAWMKNMLTICEQGDMPANAVYGAKNYVLLKNILARVEDDV